VNIRSVSYEVTPSGKKIVINKYPNEKTVKTEKWQRVRPMGYEPELRQIKQIEFDERLESDPMVARNTAFSKLQSLKDSLRNRGFCRETKRYDPPQNVNNIVEDICKEVFPEKSNSQNWSNISFGDHFVKYKFLTKCSKQLNYEIPNSILYLMKTVSDVLKFYSTPVRGITSYEEMVQKSDEMPQNLHVIGEPVLYNPENDTFFGGLNAYPFTTYQMRGLRAKKKYSHFKKQEFVWPDV